MLFLAKKKFDKTFIKAKAGMPKPKYLSAVAVISTSFFEGNPKTVLEAMGSGCIVVASDIPNHRELIDDKVNGYLFDLENPNLLNIYGELISEKSFMENISNNSKQNIKAVNK